MPISEATEGPQQQGEMARRIQSHDWAATSIGPRESWPSELKCVVEVALVAGFPMIVLWGGDLTQIYNDHYRNLMGDKHPAGLGQPTRDCWPEVWHINEPIYQRVLQGETVTLQDALFPIHRHGTIEDAWFTLSYAPLRCGGQIGGVLVTLFETTQASLDRNALRASEQRFRAFVIASCDVVYRMSPDWVEMRELDGQGFLANMQEPSRDWWDRYIRHEDRAAVQQAIDRALSTKTPFELEHPVVRADGQRGWVLSRAVPILDDHGEISEWLGAGSDVTQRHESEQRYRTLYESIDEGFCVLDMLFDAEGRPVDYLFVEANPAFERQSGLSDAVGRRMRELAPDHEQRWYDIFGRVAETGEPVRFEGEAVALDRWFDVYVFRMGEPEQRRIAVLFRDIGERKQAEAGLEAELAAMNRLQDLARKVAGESELPALLYMILDVTMELAGADFGSLQLYDAESQSLRIAAHRHFGQDFLDWFARVDASEPSSCGMALRTGNPIEIEDVDADPDFAPNRVIARAAGYRAVQSTPLIDRNGQPLGMISTHWSKPHRLADRDRRLIDICADLASVTISSNAARSALRTSEEQLRLIVENARDYAIFTTDIDGLITDWREGAEAVFGFTREEIVGQDAALLFTPEDREREEPRKEREIAIESGKAPNVRWHMRKNGSRVFIEGVATLLRDPDDGTVAGFLKIGRDVTERHSAEQRQRLLLFELQHRVRNILAVMRSIARRSAETAEDVEDYQRHLEGRITALARTQSLLTRHVGGAIDLQNLILDELDVQAAEPGQFSLSGPDVSLPPKAAEVLGLAIHELATNAVKYGALAEPAGHIDIRWNLTPTEASGYLSLTWSESGVPIDQPPVRQGFGSMLVKERVPYELRGTGTLEFRQDGVLATIELPLTPGLSILQTDAAFGSRP